VDKHFGTSGRKNQPHADQQNQRGPAQPVLYSNLTGAEVQGSGGDQLGTVTDAWLNLHEGRVALVEIQPSTAVGSPFRTLPVDLRFELPATKLQSASEEQVQFNLTVNDLETAPHVGSVDWVTTDQGQAGRVLRLDTSAERQRNQNPNEASADQS
jgi:sporulation protein YlmC with PRC-barrel domain